MDDDIVFRGEGPCDVFLRRARKVAFEKGKHKDGDWMAGYVSTCFEGEALKWYEGLDEDVQDDWKQLRTALLERFPPVSGHPPQPGLDPSSSSIPLSCVPTAPAAPQAGSLESQPVTWIHAPAAAPPPAPSLPSTPGDARPSAPFRGRLAVISDSPGKGGYVGKSRAEGFYNVTEDPNQALRVEYTPRGSGQPVDFRLLDSLPEGDFDRLGVVWHNEKPIVAALSTEYALCVAVRGPASERKVSCKTGFLYPVHRGPVDTTVWSLSLDGSVYPVWKTDDRNYYPLQTAVFSQRLVFVPDWKAYREEVISTLWSNFVDKARLVLEPI